MQQKLSAKTRRAWLFDLSPSAIASFRVVAVGDSAVGDNHIHQDGTEPHTNTDDVVARNTAVNARQEAPTGDKIAIDTSRTANSNSSSSSSNAGLACGHCGLGFPDIAAQRTHARSPLHRFNLRRAARSLRPLTARELSRAVRLDDCHVLSPAGQPVRKSDAAAAVFAHAQARGTTDRARSSSRSRGRPSESDSDGSGPTSSSSSSSSSENGDVEHADLPGDVFVLAEDLAADAEDGVVMADSVNPAAADVPGSRLMSPEDFARMRSRPVVYFASDAVPGKSLAMRVYKVAIADPRDADEAHAAGRAPYAPLLADALSASSRIRIYLLVSAGHVACAVTDGSAVIAHKTFHRYVVRAKRGTRQAAKDGTGKKPKSAGASIRRENERLLREETRALLESWSSYFASAAAILISAPGAINRGTIVYDGSPVTNGDPRVRQIPFTTARPTLAEVKRVHQRLYHVAFFDPEGIAPLVEQAEAERKRRMDQMPAPAPETSPAPAPASAPAPNDDDGDDDDDDEEKEEEEEEEEEEAVRAAGVDNGDEVKNNEDGGKGGKGKKRSKNKNKNRKGKGKGKGKAAKPRRVPPPDNDLLRAVRLGDRDAVDVLLRADPSSCDNDPSIAWTYTPLCLAAKKGDGAIVGLLIDAGADTETRTEDNWTALCHASASGSASAVTTLLDAGANPTVSVADGRVPYNIAPPGGPARDALRAFAGREPEMWDWAVGAQVHDPLAPEMVHEAVARREQQAKKRAQKKKQKSKNKAKIKREEDKIRHEELRREMMTPAERAAAAAEARAQQMRAAADATTTDSGRSMACAACARLFAPSQVPFRKDGLSFCSTSCVRVYLSSLRMASAAVSK